MTEGTAYVLSLAESNDVATAGGKAANLARLMAGGFNVPDGFVVTTDAFRHAVRQSDAQMPVEVADAVKNAYRRLGSPVVAVRSSATAEDATNASMAGQYTTFLDLQGEQQVLKAIEDCWASGGAERVRAYLDKRQVSSSNVEMAVVVQTLVPADVAGVLFTSNPRTGNDSEMMIEASWGLGESVVSGLVQPDVIVVDADTGDVKESIVNDKRTYIDPVTHKQQDVPKARRKAPCLSAANIAELAGIGGRLKQHFGLDQDAEWAIHDDRLYVLQSRAITTLADTQSLRQCIEQTREQVRRGFQQGHGPWVLHNIAETLGHPTPLTWSIIRRFMSGAGGFGKMYRQIGFEPSEIAERQGFLDLIGGRIYMDLSRTAEMFFADFPFVYDIDLIRSNPDAAQGPPTKPAGSLCDRYRVGKRIAEINTNLQSLGRVCDRNLRERIMPEFIESVRHARNRDITRLSPDELIETWKRREAHVLDGFAPDAFLPSLICAMAIEQLRTFLHEHFWQENPTELVNLLTVAAEPDSTVRANQGLFEIAAGKMSVEQWIEQYGHRAAQEYHLASPRWRECPETVRSMAARLGQDQRPPPPGGRPPADPFLLRPRRGHGSPTVSMENRLFQRSSEGARGGPDAGKEHGERPLRPGADTGVAGRTRIALRESLQERFSMGVGRGDETARREGAVGVHHQKSLARPASGNAPVVEEGRDVVQEGGVGFYSAVAFLEGQELLEDGPELRQVLLRHHVPPVVGPEPGVWTIVHPDSPVGGQAGQGKGVSEIVALDHAVQGDGLTFLGGEGSDQLLQVAEETRNHAELVVTVVRVVQGDAVGIHTGFPGLTQTLRGQERAVGDQDDVGAPVPLT